MKMKDKLIILMLEDYKSKLREAIKASNLLIEEATFSEDKSEKPQKAVYINLIGQSYEQKHYDILQPFADVMESLEAKIEFLKEDIGK